MANQSMGLQSPIFQDADKAREYLESIRWPNGPVCPHCGCDDDWTKLEGAKHRPGLYQCNACRQQFTVTVGTLFERSKVPLNKWLLAAYLLCSSKKGISSHQLHRMLDVTYKSEYDDLDALYRAIGYFVIDWGQIETGITASLDIIYRFASGPKPQKSIPPGLGRKLDLLKDCLK